MGKFKYVLGLVKGTERYIFLYDDNSTKELFSTMGKYASDGELSFSWYDTAVLSQKIRKLRKEREKKTGLLNRGLSDLLQ